MNRDSVGALTHGRRERCGAARGRPVISTFDGGYLDLPRAGRCSSPRIGARVFLDRIGRRGPGVTSTYGETAHLSMGDSRASLGGVSSDHRQHPHFERCRGRCCPGGGTLAGYAAAGAGSAGPSILTIRTGSRSGRSAHGGRVRVCLRALCRPGSAVRAIPPGAAAVSSGVRIPVDFIGNSSKTPDVNRLTRWPIQTSCRFPTLGRSRTSKHRGGAGVSVVRRAQNRGRSGLGGHGYLTGGLLWASSPVHRRIRPRQPR